MPKWLRLGAVVAIGMMLTVGAGGTTVSAAGVHLAAGPTPRDVPPPHRPTASPSLGERAGKPVPRLTWSLQLHRVELGLSRYDKSDASFTLVGSARLAEGATGPLTYSAAHLTEYSNDVPTDPPGFSSVDPCGFGPPHPFGYCNMSTRLVGTRPGTLREQRLSLSKSGTVSRVQLAIGKTPTEMEDYSCTGDCGTLPTTGEDSLASETLRKIYDPNVTGYFTISGFHDVHGVLTSTQHRTATTSPFRYTVEATWKVCGAGGSQCQLKADPGGPYRVVRGGSVTLDGSKSTPSPGEDITSYRWEVSPAEKCGDHTPELAQTSFEGEKVGPFTMLCGLKVRLTITSGGHTAHAETTVTVRPRDWHVAPLSNVDSSASSSLIVGETLGENVGQCPPSKGRLDPGPDPFCPVNPDAGFVVETVGDKGGPAKGGPFDGISYVKSASFSISRVSLYNRRYEPGGDIYQHNVASKRYAAAMRRLNHSIHVHEHSHGQALITEAGTEKGNVNQLLEPLVGSYNGVIDQAEHRVDDASKDVWKYAEDGSGHLAGDWSGRLEFPDGPGGSWVAETCFTGADDALHCKGTIILTPGTDGSFRARGFTPGEKVSGQLHSRVFDLGTTTATADGTARFVVHLPATFPPGKHEAVLRGQSSGRVVRLAVDVKRHADPALPSTISEGSTGPDVRWAQYLLVRRTLSDDQIDGIFGPVTERAVKEFQHSANLVIDGIIGPQTWRALGGGAAEPPTLAEGSTGAVVERLQRALNEGRGQLAPGTGPTLAVDGDYGPVTARAVEAMQDEAGISVDGVVGLQTWAVPVHAAGQVLASLCQVKQPGTG